MKFDKYRILGWLIPGLIMAVSAFVVFRQMSTLGEAQRLRDEASLDVESATVEKANVDAQGAERRFAAAESNDMEQTLFLNDLRSRVTQSGAVITNWTTNAGQYAPAGTTGSTLGAITPADPKDAELLKGITRVSSTLTLAGEYRSIRSFLGDLQKSDRLFTLTNVNWTRTKENTSLIVTVARYIAPRGNAAAPDKPDLASNAGKTP